MTTQEFIDENKTITFKKGDIVTMRDCGEADIYPGINWECKTDSYKDRAGQDVVFLNGFTGCFMCKYLTIVSNA